MEELKMRYEATQKALAAFQESLILIEKPENQRLYRQLRDSCIQTFEFSIDTLWKLLRVYVLHTYQIAIDPVTPKSVFRECLKVHFISKEEFDVISDIIDARNITSHTYNETLAEKVFHDLPSAYELMHKILQRIQI